MQFLFIGYVEAFGTFLQCTSQLVSKLGTFIPCSTVWQQTEILVVEFATVANRTAAIWSVMLTSSNGSIFRVTGPLWGESTGDRWIPRAKASDASFDVFYELRLIKRLSKQSRRWWFETSSRPLCHYDIIVMITIHLNVTYYFFRLIKGSCDIPKYT